MMTFGARSQGLVEVSKLLVCLIFAIESWALIGNTYCVVRETEEIAEIEDSLDVIRQLSSPPPPRAVEVIGSHSAAYYPDLLETKDVD
jgi:hypothetical protein